MASVVDICNRALSRVGAARITALTDGSKNAVACSSAYEFVRDEVLRAHPWNCVSTRASVAKSATAPAHGYDNEFPWPADCLAVLEADPDFTWVVEGRNILTDADAPLDIRYIKQETDPTRYDAIVLSAIAARLKIELAEELTQSNTKVKVAWEEYKEILRIARRADAREQSSMPLAEDDWIIARL